MTPADRCPHEDTARTLLNLVPEGEQDLLAEMRGYLSTFDSPVVLGSEPPPITELPFEPLSPLSAEEAKALETEVIRRNDRYLYEVIEKHSFCPYAKYGRMKRRTVRHVFHAESRSLDVLFELMAHVAAEPQHQVIQVIFPRLEVGAEEWSAFALAVTSTGNKRMGGMAILACAPLHPELVFSEETPYSLVPLFRRAPDPTIQWVRLDALKALYDGHSNEDVYMSPEDIIAEAFPPARSSMPLYDKVCHDNFELARTIGVKQIVELLAEIAADRR
ncbi:MAG: hypothetical protein AUK47_06520 [Deltaproteobacteria bacterium CG2_30_63_29]|nr:MAG: hypothetical protein AUK47_06520 [Deltaproteobacteria bacterium CG2_30_63_29]PJB34449.1 MAG: hypothetical protein CO108_28225 [Deltaproteobacteria bacterium CG_4_9_14_3_um_filter_63_12]